MTEIMFAQRSFSFHVRILGRNERVLGCQIDNTMYIAQSAIQAYASVAKKLHHLLSKLGLSPIEPMISPKKSKIIIAMFHLGTVGSIVARLRNNKSIAPGLASSRQNTITVSATNTNVKKAKVFALVLFASFLKNTNRTTPKNTDTINKPIAQPISTSSWIE